MNTPAPPQLDYGTAPPRTMSNALRWVIFIAICVGGYAAWQWGRGALAYASVYYRQRACLRYTASPGQVVYEEDRARAADHLANRNTFAAYPLERYGEHKFPAATARFPDCWTQFEPLVRKKLMGIPRDGEKVGAILFLHERISPAGNRRLVCVRYYAETFSFTPDFIESYNIESSVITPATWGVPAAQAARPLSVAVASGFPRQPPALRIFAGQVDPADHAHFTVRYQMWGREDVLDGRLRDDDTVTLQPRNQPAEPP